MLTRRARVARAEIDFPIDCEMHADACRLDRLLPQPLHAITYTDRWR